MSVRKGSGSKYLNICLKTKQMKAQHNVHNSRRGEGEVVYLSRGLLLPSFPFTFFPSLSLCRSLKPSLIEGTEWGKKKGGVRDLKRRGVGKFSKKSPKLLVIVFYSHLILMLIYLLILHP